MEAARVAAARRGVASSPRMRERAGGRVEATVTYADLKTDYAFQKVFGHDEVALTGLLNDLLGREGERAIASLQYLPRELAPVVPGAKLSILDVRCESAGGERFVVEMQVLPVTAFLNRVVYNACKAYVGGLAESSAYGELIDVVAVSICDFELWPDAEQRVRGAPNVPLCSRWRMREASGAEGLGQVQYVFLELPKLGDRVPVTAVDWWASLFRLAPHLKREQVERSQEINAAQRRALELAETARWSLPEQDAYLRAREEVDQVRRMNLTAREQGRAEGHAAGRAEGATALLGRQVARRLGRPLDEVERQRLHAAIERDGAEAVDDELGGLDPAGVAAWLRSGGR